MAVVVLLGDQTSWDMLRLLMPDIDFELLDSIRFNLYDWLMSLKVPNGSFIMHEHGESDTRSTYCVLVIARLLNIATDELLEGVEDWIDMCQTYEGGFSNVPNTEAHGGYRSVPWPATSCCIQVARSKRQEQRTAWIGRWIGWKNKQLVDACYSFWVGALYPLVEILLGRDQELFSGEALKHYILRIAQEETGGFRDKPGKGVDFYHTNYTLAGLSLVEHTTS
ncbi:Protein farnesyltransferase subunit beta [Candida viswanathii]|uniref:Protein farnesyltransferase subunit beta n=1 Tax=Candida viswanathii TaxID=5486 RepID=A0A367XZX1_9ASCO|nr:Protein farnesyltransferase subunit beta [Candida viswanathii]